MPCMATNAYVNEASVLSQPTVCVLTGFNTVQDAFKVVPHKHIPFVILCVQNGHLAYAFDDFEEVRIEPDVVLLNALSLKHRVFVLCDRFTDLTPNHRSCVSHVICSSTSCDVVVPQCNDLLWLDLERMRFAFLF